MRCPAGLGLGLLMAPSRAAASPYNRCKGSIYLVFDFCEHDLAGLLSNVLVKFTLSEIKRVMQMLLNGLYYIHRNKVRAGGGVTVTMVGQAGLGTWLSQPPPHTPHRSCTGT